MNLLKSSNLSDKNRIKNPFEINSETFKPKDYMKLTNSFYEFKEKSEYNLISA